ncbi:MAG: trypsin-like peptidase domain-containing protein [Candidatus Pacebacteria bacterium]|nr:trypsin-like peptidase domain-containing protein [Candidatus Paceibacterota bacterium]
MQFITDILVTIVASYLAFTNFLALEIESFFTPEPSTISIEKSQEEKVSILSSLPSIFSADTIPDILLKNKDYQKASVVESSLNRTIQDPLLAIVNIFCTFSTPTTIRTTTGTGFFVHSNGVILTNAHVAQYLLLEKTELLGEAECLVRTGNPAKAEYQAELLYIPPTWVQKNASLIDDKAPSGTGERDYALLYVSNSVTRTPLPAYFPALEINTDFLPVTIKGNEVRASGYPATDLIKNGANTPLLPRSATTSISDLYTFGSNYADVFSIKGSNVGAEGSSGGPIVTSNGQVVGMIVTRGDDETDGPGSLRAITLSHIDRTIKEETGFSLNNNLSGNIEKRSQVFTETLVPFLVELLSIELQN